MTDNVDVFDALCVWEELLENSTKYPGAERYRENNGVCETRQRVIEMTPTISAAWEAALDAGYDSPFDFEFVPMALLHGSNAPDGEDGGLSMYPMYEKDPALLGRYLALLDRVEQQARIVQQAMKEMRTNGKTAWTPERIIKASE